MKKLLIPAILLFSIAGVLVTHSSKTLNSEAPQAIGNGNCTYANGLVRSCPPSLMYTNGMDKAQPLDTSQPESDAPPTPAPVLQNQDSATDSTPQTSPETPAPDTPVFNPLTDTNPIVPPNSTGRGLTN